MDDRGGPRSEIPAEVDVQALERRFHEEPKFNELVRVLADSVESGRIKLADVQDAVTLLKFAAGRRQPAIWLPLRF